MKTIIEVLTGKPYTVREAFRKLLGPSRLYLDGLDPHPRSAVILAGSYRSGTSWISEVLTFDNRIRYLWEPFHLRGVPSMNRFARLPRIYLRPDDPAGEFRKYVRQVLSGRVRHIRIDQYNQARFPVGRMVKDVHSNLFVKWLRTQFPESPILFLMRHPCAVAHSARALSFHDYLGHPLDYFGQSELMADHLEPFRELIANTTETFDRLVLLWCVENYVPLRQLSRGDVLFLFYEQLCAAPEVFVRPIFEWTGRRYTESVPRRFKVPSQTSWGDHSGMKHGRDPAAHWSLGVTADERRRALRMLQAFGLDAIYHDEVMPTPEGLENFLGAPHSNREAGLSSAAGGRR